MMTGSQKVLRVVSIIIIVWAILIIAAALLSIFVSMFSDASQMDPEVYATGMSLGLAGMVIGLVYLAGGIFGLRGAKDAHRIMPFMVISIFGFLLTLFNMFGLTANGVMISPQNFISLLLLGFCSCLAINIRRNA